MDHGIDYSSLTMQTCESRCSRPKGQFVLYNMEQSSSCRKQCYAKVIRDIYQSVLNGFLAKADACKQ